MQKRAIHLQPPERDQLITLVSKEHNQANVIKRAYMLLHSDAGFKDETIAQLLFSSEDSVRRVRIRYLNEDLDATLQDKPRPKSNTGPSWQPSRTSSHSNLPPQACWN